MASTFKVKTSRSVGTTPTAVGGYTVASATQTTIIGLAVANVLTGSLSASQIIIEAAINDGVNDTYIIKNAQVPGGSSIVLVGGDQKIVLETGYSVKVTSDTASSADVILSILELT